MKRNRLHISRWPFPQGESVTLSWIESPLQVDAQKKSKVWFRRSNGEHEPMELPWGMLPQWRLGQHYFNGADQRRCHGRQVQLQIPPVVAPAIMSGKSSLPDALRAILPECAGEERCFVFFNADRKIVLPVIEAVRALLTPTRFLAAGILHPSYFERVLENSEHLPEEKLLKLSFTSEIPPAGMKALVIRHIARLLYDSSFKEAWESLYFNQQMIGGAQSPHLQFTFPILGSDWMVRAVSIGDVTFIYELLSVLPLSPLPFEMIEVIHPSFKKRRIPATTPSGERIQQRDSGKTVLKASSSPPLSSGTPKQIGGGRWVLRSKKDLWVRRLCKEISEGEPSGIDEKDSTGEQTREKPAPNSQEISFGDIDSNGGTHPLGEFSPGEGDYFQVDPDDGLDKFSETVRSLQLGHPEIFVEWKIRAVDSRDRCFSGVKNVLRKYALVQLLWSIADSCWIIEFGRPDGHYISTLLMAPPLGTPWVQGEALVRELIATAVTAQGQWNGMFAAEVQKEKGVCLFLLRHGPASSASLGQRLYTTARWLRKVADSGETYQAQSGCKPFVKVANPFVRSQT